MGESLREVQQALTRYSANNPQFPVNDRSLCTGKSHAIGGRSAAKRNPADSADPKFKEGRCEGADRYSLSGSP
jgi:hypothetical protein